uniref:Transglutaminase-like domain-containing protein n=1 Tax=Methanococcus maripaludis (strain C6 / ATCC BAA-1332) TaxID=444158 RepID=A9AB94_METM6
MKKIVFSAVIIFIILSGCIEDLKIISEEFNILTNSENLNVNINSETFEKGDELTILGSLIGKSSEVNVKISKYGSSEYIISKNVSISDSGFEFKMNTESLETGNYSIKITTESGFYKIITFEILNNETYIENENNNELDENYNLKYSDYYLKNYSWSYDNKKWHMELSIPKSAYEYYKNKPHNREDNYAQYALSDYDKTYLESMIQIFEAASVKYNYSICEELLLITSFVQSLDYTSDSDTTDFDEYPRYPLETLVDMGGDCEDKSILTAALLNELGYDVVLVELSDHMAIGINCDEKFHGSYYEYMDKKYYYLETTDENWFIGEIPEKYLDDTVIIRPLIQIPRIIMNFSAEKIAYDKYYVYYNVTCNLENLGPGTAKNPEINIAAVALEDGENYVWNSDTTIELENYEEGDYAVITSKLKIPRNSLTKIRCTISGDNFKTVEVSSQAFNT